MTFVLAYNPTGSLLATGGGIGDSRIKLWNVADGQEIWQKNTGNNWVGALTFSADGKQLAAGGDGEHIEIWDIATGIRMKTLSFPEPAGVEALMFSPDGNLLASEYKQRSIKIWDLTNNEIYRTLSGHSSGIQVMRFAYDNRYLISGSWDGTTRIWNVEEGKEICKLIHFVDGSWAVIDSAGRYDASNGGEVKWLHWVIENEPIELEQLKESYYEPGLLAKVLGFNQEPLRIVNGLEDVDLYPQVSLETPTPDDKRLRIHIENRGGGIGQTLVYINNKEIIIDECHPIIDSSLQELEMSLDIADHRNLYHHPDSTNSIEVQAYNKDNSLSSRNVRVIYKTEARPDIAPPHLWGIVAGVSDYHGDEIDLRFAGKDAVDFAAALRIGAGNLFDENVHLKLLTTEAGAGIYPNKENIIQVFKAMADSVKSTDILVVYLAGHGVNYRDKEEDDYYFLTADAFSGNLDLKNVRQQNAISSSEMREIIKKIAALKQVLILDTCASGRMVEKLTQARQISSSQVRALERVKDRTGMFVLAGAAADAVSYEASRFGQGLLTYSLLFGMRGAALREISARGRAASLVFLDTDEFPQAYKLSGRYTITEESITVTVYLLVGKEAKGNFQVKGKPGNKEQLVADILRETERWISK